MERLLQEIHAYRKVCRHTFFAGKYFRTNGANAIGFFHVTSRVVVVSPL